MSTNTAIQLKKSGETGNTPGYLQHGEVAINYADGKLYYKDDFNNIRYINNQDSFSTIVANGNSILALSSTDILTINPGHGSNISANIISKTITLDVNENELTSFVTKTGDTMSGALTGITNLDANTITVNTIVNISSNTIYVQPSMSGVVVDEFPTTTYRSAKYQMQITDENLDHHVIELRVMHDGTTAYLTQYGEMYTSYPLVSFDASITSGVFDLLVTSLVSQTTTIKFIRESITV